MKSRRPFGKYGVARFAQLGAGIVIVTLVASACSSSSKSSSTGGSGGTGSASQITLAALADLTGANASIGLPVQGGAQTAIKEINDAGGVNGAKLTLKSFDAQSSVSASGSVVRDAEASKPAAIIGEVVSSELAPAASVISAGGVPWVSANTPSAVTDNDEFWFTTTTGAAASGQTALGGMKALLGGSLSGKTIALQALSSPAADAIVDSVKTALTGAGATIGSITRDPLSINSWSSQAAKVVASHADAIVTTDNEPVTAIVAKALGVAGFKGPILSLSGASSDSLLSAVNLPNFYAMRETVAPTADSPMAKAASAVGQSANVNNPYFLKSYADVYVVAAVLKKCGNDCSLADFTSTLKGLGDITIPNGAMAGSLNFASSQCGLTASRVWGWDAGSKASVTKSPVIAIGSSQ